MADLFLKRGSILTQKLSGDKPGKRTQLVIDAEMSTECQVCKSLL